VRLKPLKRLRLDSRLQARIKRARVSSGGNPRQTLNFKVLVVLAAGSLLLVGGGMSAVWFAFKSPKNIPGKSLSPPRFTQPYLVKGVYLPAEAAGRKTKVDTTLELLRATELNAVVLDIKDSTGLVSYQSRVPRAQEISSSSDRISDIRDLILQFHEANVYVIGRIVVFQDSVLAEAHPELGVKSKKTGKLWRDRKGIAWIDPSAQAVWVYNAELAQEAAHLGFDEINFDYVRFPSDGVLSDMKFPLSTNPNTPKYEVMRQFFEYLDMRLRKQSQPSIPISVDIFGMTFWRGGEDDLNIGQRLEDAVKHFDYIQPMLYPSHFPPTFEGFKNPAEHPFEIVERSLAQKKELFSLSTSKMRPWLQDFDLGAEYTKELVLAQAKAAQEQGAFGWTFWNAGGTYTKEAFAVDPSVALPSW